MMAIAHRGYSARFPENSRAAFEAAIQAGAEYVEMDARLSADGVVICGHDADFERLTGQPSVIADTAASSLLDLDIGDGEPPLRLADALALVGARVKALIDVKMTDERLTAAVVDCVQAAGLQTEIVIGLRAREQVAYVAARDATLPCLGLVGDYDEIPAFFETGAIAVRAWEEDIDHPAVQRALRNKQPVWVTAGRRRDGEVPGYITAARLARLRQAGIEAVLLNDPTLMSVDADDPRRGRVT